MDQNPSRPKQVTLAAACMGASMALQLLRAVQEGIRGDHQGIIAGIIIVIIHGLWIFLILRRQNWARWILIVLIGLVLVKTISRFNEWFPRYPRYWSASNWVTLGIFIFARLLLLAEAVLLLTRPAREWFRSASGGTVPTAPPKLPPIGN